ncbi:glycosyltransferase family 2 protein [bacterium]|nr:glycosyltransferase family 2 protein [candidate division CSSED10-310 bacterium]
MYISIVMPAYNEEANIKQTVESCIEVLKGIPGEHEVVVTDDGSLDDTGKILKKLQKNYENLKITENKPNKGYGAALRKAVLASSGHLIVSIDSDGQFDIKELPLLLSQWETNMDILSGYRKAKKDSWVKVVGDRCMNRMIRLLFQVPYKDTNCAFKIYKGDMLRNMNLEARGFQIPTEIILKAHAKRMNISEAPVGHRERKGGVSALTPLKTAMGMAVFLCYLRIKICLYRRNILRDV